MHSLEPKLKTSEIEKLSLEDLKEKLTEFQKQLLDLKMNHAISPLENPLQIKTVRKTVARLLTAILIILVTLP